MEYIYNIPYIPIYNIKVTYQSKMDENGSPILGNLHGSLWISAKGCSLGIGLVLVVDHRQRDFSGLQPRAPKLVVLMLFGTGETHRTWCFGMRCR